MQITVIPATSKACRAAIERLLGDASLPTVIGVYRDIEKAPEAFTANPRFKAVQGDASNLSSLHFTGSQAVLALTPPKYDGSDVVKWANQICGNIRAAVKQAGSVQRLVYVSSGGAQYAEGVGEIKSNHTSEENYRHVVPEVIFVRNTFFMENWEQAVNTAKNESFFYSPLTPVEHKIPMISTQDIGITCAEQILGTGTAVKMVDGASAFELYGPEEYSSLDVKAALETALGKKIDLHPVQPDGLADFFGSFLPESLVADFVEMYSGHLPGGLMDSDFRNGQLEFRRGSETLTQAFRRMLAHSNLE